MSDEFKLFLAGGIVGVIIKLTLFAFSATNSPSRQAIRDCEKDLPRSQHCVITAVPEPKKD